MGWRRGWDSNPEPMLMRRNLLILHDGKDVKNGKSGTSLYNFVQTQSTKGSDLFLAQKIQVGVTAGTRIDDGGEHDRSPAVRAEPYLISDLDFYCTEKS